MIWTRKLLIAKQIKKEHENSAPIYGQQDKQKKRKNSSRKEKRNQCALSLIGQSIAESLGGGIDSRKEIDLWLLQMVSSIAI